MRTGETERQLIGRAGKFALIVLGGVLTAALVFSVDMHALWRDLAAVGIGFGAILALHIVVTAIDGSGWRSLLPADDRGSAALLLWARCVRESANLLLPVAQVGGEVVGARILVLNGVRLRHAGASVILDKLTEAATQVLFAAMGLAALVALRGASDLARGIGLGLAGVCALAAATIGVRQAGGFARLERRLLAVARKILALAPDEFAAIATAMKSSGRARRLVRAVCLHLGAWCLSCGEVWLALRFMGHPIGIAAALAIESLGSTVAAAGFLVPGALGVQESGYMAISVALGLPAELGLAMSLVRRARQIVLGLPALASWQVAELGWVGRRAAGSRADLPLSNPTIAAGSD